MNTENQQSKKQEPSVTKYFTKYLPVEGTPTEGDTSFWESDEGYFSGRFFPVVKSNLFHTQAMGWKKYRLFLCSRDLKIGDMAFAGNEEEYAGNVIDENDLKNWKEYLDAYKVIGEISPDALSFVKEGDEFTEDQVQYYAEDKFGQYCVEKEIEKSFEIHLIKGQCGHFH